MAYFRKFPSTAYRFGNEVNFAVATDLTPYINLIDQIKDDISFLTFYTIQEGYRPDQVSVQLYDTPLYYWTFYLLNDNISYSIVVIVDYLISMYPIIIFFMLCISLTLSSTVIASKVLDDRKELKTFHGRISIIILIFQDILALILLTSISFDHIHRFSLFFVVVYQ